MTVKTKSIEVAARKFEERAVAAAGDYKSEALASASLWATNTANAKGNYQAAGISATLADRFAGGVRKAGAGKYSRKVEALADRYAPGVSAGVADYKDGEAPMLQTIQGLTLPVRKNRGDPGNKMRSGAVGDALHIKRLALLGVTGSGGA